MPRQIDMFTGELVDTRTPRQKQLDKEREQPKQTEMFSQREIAQFGVNPRPLLPISPKTKLGLIFEDHRTEEEKEQDRQREAEERTYKMFDGSPDLSAQSKIGTEEILTLVPYQDPCMALMVIDHICLALMSVEEGAHDQ